MKKTMFFTTAAVFLAILMLAGCSNPSSSSNDNKELVKSVTLNRSSLALDLAETTSFTLTATIVNGAAGDSVIWTSSDTDENYVTISSDGVNCTVTAVAETESPVTVTATLSSDSGKKAVCSVTVTGEPVQPADYELALYTNAAPGNPTREGEPTMELPDPVNNIYTINCDYDPVASLNSILPTSAGGFGNATFLYLNHPVTGDYKFRVRARMTSTPASNSTSKGIIIGGFTADGDGPNTNSMLNGIVYRCSGGSGSLPYAIRSALSKTASQPDVGGLNVSVAKDTEFIFEVTRTSTGFTHTVYISKSGEELPGTNNPYSPSSYSGLAIQPDTPVYPCIAFASVMAEVSQIELWVGDLTGDPVYYSGDSAAAPVSVSAITVGVDGGNGMLSTTNAGTASDPATYTIKASDAASGIQLTSAVIPSYADEQGVTYWLSQAHTNDPGITVDQNTGLVTVTAPGTATIQAISNDVAEPDYFLTIIATADYVAVGDFNITGSLDSIQEGQQTTYSTDIGPAITNPVVVWTASPAGAVKFLDSGTQVDSITGPSATVIGITATAEVTITATATTTDGTTPTTKSADKTIAVTTAQNTIFSWNTGDGYTDNSKVNGVSVHRGGGTVGVDGNGNLSLTGGGRFVLGFSTPVYSSGTATSSSAYVTNAELDLSRKFMITVVYDSSAGAGNFFIYLNNDGTSSANGVLSYSTTKNSVLVDLAPPAATGGTISLTVDPDTDLTLTSAAVTAGIAKDDVLHNSFLNFRCDSSNNSFIISSILIEYVD